MKKWYWIGLVALSVLGWYISHEYSAGHWIAWVVGMICGTVWGMINVAGALDGWE